MPLRDVPLLCALVELLPTAARRASGSAPPALARALSTGSSMAEALGGAARDAGATSHHALARPSCYRRAASGSSLAGLGHVQTSRYARRTGRWTTLPRRPRFFARSSSCCRPPRGGRWAALLALRFGTLSTGPSMAEALGRRRTRLLRRRPSLHALARPSCYRRAPSAARALAGPAAYRPVDTLDDTLDARAAPGDAPATPSPWCALVELLPTARGGRWARSSCSPGTPLLRLVDGRRARRRTRLLRRHPSLHALARPSCYRRPRARSCRRLVAHGLVDALDARAASDDARATSCYFARSSSRRRPPRGGRWAALLMLRFGTPSTGSSMAGRPGGAARDATAPPPTRARAAVATDGPRALLVLWPDSVTYDQSSTLDARAASDDAPTTSSLLCALVELLPTAAGGVGQRSSCFGSALTGSSMVEAGGPHATAGAALHYTRSRGRHATDGLRALSCSGGLGHVQTSRHVRRTGHADDAPATSSRFFAHSSSCCRPPQGGRRAALLMLWLSALHGLVDGRRLAAPHATATAPPFTIRARAAVMLPTGRER